MQNVKLDYQLPNEKVLINVPHIQYNSLEYGEPVICASVLLKISEIYYSYIVNSELKVFDYEQLSKGVGGN